VIPLVLNLAENRNEMIVNFNVIMKLIKLKVFFYQQNDPYQYTCSVENINRNGVQFIQLQHI
jgi:hypothetical protein